MNNLKKWIFPAFVVIFAIAFSIIMNSLFMIVQVSGSSMNNTLQNKDVLFVDKLSAVNRGDVVVFDVSNDKYIKRVIAIEGDEIYFDEYNCVYLKKNGETEFTKLVEDYVYANTYVPDYKGPTESSPLKITEGGYYVLGDNRGNSEDSRILGIISKDRINGVVKESTIKSKGFITFIFGWTFDIKDFFSGLI